MLKHRAHSHPPHRGQSGMSIVELMVGVAIGLIIVAAASLLMAGQLVDNRRLLAETQVQQDVRATSEFIAREMRRAESTGELSALATIWYPGNSVEAAKNPYAGTLVANINAIEYRYYPTSSVRNFVYKFQLDNGSITFEAGGIQTMTDINVMRTTRFTPSVLVDDSAQIVLPCPKACSGNTSDCWPKFRMRKAQIAMEAEAKTDANVKRASSSTVRVRNDWVQFSGTNTICPT